MSGTSMATPFVSASAALLESRFPSWSAAQVATELQRTARDLGSPGRDDTYGRGLVQPVIDLRGAPSAPATVSVATTPDASSPTTTSRAVVTWSNVSYPGTYGVGAWRVQLSTDGGVHWSAIHTVSDSASRGFTFSNVPTALPVKARVAAVARLTGAVGPARDSSVVWSGADAGTTLDTATGPLTPGTSARDVIGNNSGPGADVDWFRITATTPSGSAPQPFTVGLGSAPTGSSLSIYAVRVVAGVPTVDATAITTVPGSQTVLVDPATITDTPDHYVAIVSGGNPGTAAYTLSVN